MTTPRDQKQRDRFSNDLETNFSVIAAAGSGKTRAITDRIGQIARHRRALEWLPRLVVVTFTHRAADEMQRRARQVILESGVSLEVVAAFDRAYFGTIHSFCVKLLSDYGHYLGLSPRLDLMTDDAELWHDFVQSYVSIGQALNEESRRALFRHVPVRQLMELGRRGNLALPEPQDLGPCPDLDFEAIYHFKPSARAMEKVERDQASLRDWERDFRAGTNYLPLIECSSGAKEFSAAWDEAFGPFRKWLTNAALGIASEVERAYRDFRVDHGVLTYDDQIALADSLFDLPSTADRIRERDFRVILDEAQDTDPQQFSILLEATRPPGAAGRWLERKTGPPRPGHYCMVGDLQQSIFSDRADLRQYRKIHQTLIETGAGQALEFAVTFRLDQRQVDFINATFPLLLSDTEGQVNFLELNPRPTVLPGQIVRLNIDGDPGDDKKSERYRAEKEAEQLVSWIKATGLKKLRARSWSEVAILCPRKAWFRPLRNALRRAGLEVQTQSENELNADNPAHAWLVALATIMARPRASYEIVGVLREIFGVSDHELALFAEGYGDRFQVQFPVAGEGPVAQNLNLLVDLRAKVQSAPLYQAVTQVAAGTRLRERLLTLPQNEFGDLTNELDRLLVTAANAESEGKTVADFARDLRANFDGQRESEPPERGAIQLITGQKAKGSEWDAVIVPYLSREVRPRSPDYARIVKIPQTGELVIALGRDDMTREVKDALKLADRQEMERLLYVALTRAKHTLVLAFDEKLFHTARGASPSKSQASWLRSATENAPAFAALPIEGQGCAETEQAQARESDDRRLEREVAPPPQVSHETRSKGLKASQQFVRKLTPSRVPRERQILPDAAADSWKEIEPELRPLTVDNAATRYGIWWHEFAQHIPWQSDERLQDEAFQRWETKSPDPQRSRREWELLREHLREADGFRQKAGGAGTLLRAEMPFVWPGENARCVEGIIDLALLDVAAKRWRIIDWKTNRIEPEQTSLLRGQYLPQIAAYWRAITEMTGMTVDAEIYSTSTGQFVSYDRAELAVEWERLRKLPVSDLTTGMSAESA
jgi:ATP-dependent exoDNAse (exonuclease V) beta subunit